MLFYMKTCPFRGASPRQIHEGLFCLKEPEARYGLSECGNCALCYPRLESNRPGKKSVVLFARAHDYRCLNGYRIILNAPAVSLISYTIEKHEQITNVGFDIDLCDRKHDLCSSLSMPSG